MARFRGAAVLGRLGALSLAALPGLLTLYLSFNSGGYFAGATAVAVVVLAGTVAFRMALVRDPFAGFSRPLRIATAGLAFFSVWSLISSRWSHAPSRALLDFDLANLYLFALILFGSSTRSARRVRWTLILTWLSMLAVCLAALATRLRPDLFPIPPNLSPNRLAFPLTYWNALGVFAVCGILLAAHLASGPRELWLVRILGTTAIPVFAVTILLTYSRAAVVLAPVALVAFALLARPRGVLSVLIAAGPPTAFALVDTYHAKLISNGAHSVAAVHQGRHVATSILLACAAAAILRASLLKVDAWLVAVRLSGRARRNARIGIACVCAIALLAGVGAFEGQLAHQWNNFTKADTSAGTADVRNRLDNIRIGARLPAWKVAIHAFEKNPVRGDGAGTFALDYERLRPNAGNVQQAHSLYLEVMSELGIVGFLAIALTVALLVGAPLLRARRTPSRSVWIAIGLVGLIWAVHAGVDWEWQMPAVTLPVVALCACALARRGGGRQLNSSVELLLRVGAVLIAVVVAVTASRIAVSDAQLTRGVTALNDGQCPAASADARASSSAVSSRPQPYAIVGYCDLYAESPEAAVLEMGKALQRDPANWLYHYGLAVAEAAAGRDPHPQLRQAERLDPREQILQDAAINFGGNSPRRWRWAASHAQMPVSMRG